MNYTIGGKSGQEVLTLGFRNCLETFTLSPPKKSKKKRALALERGVGP
jgi:hypothetical protein